MPNLILMGVLVQRCQQRADREGDDTISTNEWKSLISEVYGKMHAAVAQAGARYFETEATITATGSSSYALPDDHLSTIGVDFVIDASSGRRRCLDEIMVQERARLLGLTGDALYWGAEPSSIVLYPKPASGTYKHLYVPQPTDLSSTADSATIDLINVHGLAYVLWGVASIAQHKSESDQARAMGERDAALKDLEYWAALRALNNPRRRINGDDEDDDWRGRDPASWRYR